MRLLAFILSLLLLAGTVDPTRGWLIALTVVTGLAAFRPRFWGSLSVRPAIDVRLGAFIMAVLLLAGTIEPTRDWLIGLTVVTGVAMAWPKIISVDLFGDGESERAPSWSWTARPYSRSRRRRRGEGDWGEDAQREFDNWGSTGGSVGKHDDWSEV